MNFAITPNPALDLGGFVQEIIPNEKVYVHEETRFPGGNAINASRIMTRLGVPVISTGFLGGGIGEDLKLFLDQEMIHHRFIRIQHNTRVNITVSAQKTHLQTRLSFPGPMIQIEEKKALLDLITHHSSSGNFVVIGGSLPPGVRPADVGQWIKRANQKGAYVIVDSPGAVLENILQHAPFLIKPNLIEFRDLVRKNVSQLKEIIREAKVLTKKLPLVCISSVEGGALLVSKRFVCFGRAPKIRVQSTVGAGD